MRAWQSRNLISEPELVVRVTRTIHCCSEILLDRLGLELRVAYLGLLRGQGRGECKSEERGDECFHCRLLFVEQFHHVVGGFLAVHQGELTHYLSFRNGVLLAAGQGHKIVRIVGYEQSIERGLL